MQRVQGKSILKTTPSDLRNWAAQYDGVLIDLGAGDGRFVRVLARQLPSQAFIGIDVCAANLREQSRKSPENARFVISDALLLPEEFRDLATQLTINFPWGSLLRGLIAKDGAFIESLKGIGVQGARLDVRLNGGAMNEVGLTLEEGAAWVVRNLQQAGLKVDSYEELNRDQLRLAPTTWAKRLAFGRDPRAVLISARLR